MYLEHFGLREAPFSITPHTEFFFAGANRGATLEALIYAVTHDEGIVKVSGEVGSGKTMLCRMLLERLPENVETVYLANPSLSREEIVQAVAEELHTKERLPTGHAAFRALQERLLEIYATGRIVVVMVDEAHAMPPETLEEIRLLSNLESSRHKLLHIVLFGQPELDDYLAVPSMRQLKERITHNFALEPLRHADIGTYLMFRMRAAGYRGPDIFSPGAIQLIARASEGLTRRINILADKALLAAFSEDRHFVDAKQVKAAVRDAQFNPIRSGRLPRPLWVGSAMTVAAVAAIAYLAGNYTSGPREPVIAAPRAETSVATMAPKASFAEAKADVKQMPTSSNDEPGETAGKTLAATQSDPLSLPMTLDQRIEATEAWLSHAPGNHYFIQLVSTGAENRQDIDAFISGATKKLEAEKIRVYRSHLSGRDRLGVIYGEYATLEAARSDLQKLTTIGAANGAYIRTVEKLR